LLQDNTDGSRPRIVVVGGLNAGDQVTWYPTYGIAEWLWDRGVRGEPRANVGLDDVDRTDWGDGEDRVDGAAEPESRELTIGEELARAREPGIGEHLETFEQAAFEELARAREPGIGEHVETFEQAAFGVRVEVGGASVGGRAIAACLRLGDALAAVSSALSLGVVVDVAHDRGEVAIAQNARRAAATEAGTCPTSSRSMRGEI
jgi:hypothetical protein